MAGKLVEIYGVVDEGGGGGDSSAPYHRDVQFKKWRIVGGEISSIPLFVRQPCKESDIRPWMRTIKPGNMLHMEIRFTKQLVEDQLRGKVIRYFGKTRKDKELLAAAADKRPPTIRVEGFPEFQLDRDSDGYATTIAVGRRKVRLLITSDRKRTLESVCGKIRQQNLFKREYQNRLLTVLERDLLPLKNEDWLADEEKPVTAAKFRSSLKLSDVEVTSSGSYECIFDDGDQFFGHDLVVRGNLKSGPKQADLYG